MPGVPHHITQRSSTGSDRRELVGGRSSTDSDRPERVEGRGNRRMETFFGRGFLRAGGGEEYERLLERHESTGRPLGPKRFVVMLEKALARVLQPRKRGRKPLRRV